MPDPSVAAGTVVTVLGPISAADLGVVLPHEHLLCKLYRPPDLLTDEHLGERLTMHNLGWVRQNWASNLDNLQLTSERVAIEELTRYKTAGGGTLVDLTQDGIGRAPAALARISRATGVHIVMGCGAYVGPTHPARLADASSEEIAAAMLAEIENGVRRSGVRPGILGEIGCTWPLQDGERRVLAAAVAVQAATGMAISVHPGRNHEAPDQIIDILEEAGANMRRVVMGHLDRTIQDLPGLLEVARHGLYLEFDLFGLETSYYPWSGVPEGLSDAQRLALVRGLIDAGFGDRVVLSHDICTKHRLARYGGHGYDHLLTNVRRWMRTRGFSEPELDRLFVTNPAQMLAATSLANA